MNGNPDENGDIITNLLSFAGASGCPLLPSQVFATWADGAIHGGCVEEEEGGAGCKWANRCAKESSVAVFGVLAKLFRVRKRK